MKKIILSIGILISVSCYSQDTIIIPKKAIPILKIATTKGDTAHSFMFAMYDISKDTLSDGKLVVWLLDKNGKKIEEYDIVVPVLLANKWNVNRSLIDSFIVSKNKKLVKK